MNDVYLKEIGIAIALYALLTNDYFYIIWSKTRSRKNMINIYSYPKTNFLKDRISSLWMMYT